MTPAARVQAAATILDRIRGGEAAEKALTSWARRSRFAGAKDRAAIRDHVFDGLRMWRSAAVAGGGESGRLRMLGLLRLQGVDPDTMFTGLGHAPGVLTQAERDGGATPVGTDGWDLPDWLAARFVQDLGEAAEANALALRARAPVFVRANLLRATRAEAQARLADEGILAQPHPLSDTALQVAAGARGLVRSAAFTDGWIEMQDAASQAVVDMIPLQGAARVLDYCAGGGGKALALAARAPHAAIFAHDIDPGRMADLPVRAARAGAAVTQMARPTGLFDVVMADAPCSGSGAWRRAPDGKWRLTEARLAELTAIQTEILDRCAAFVAPGGWLAYATCSVLSVENQTPVAGFLARHPGWQQGPQRRFLPTDGGDGFFISCIRAVGA